ncbi:MAG: alanine racemase [Alphaproteobacteria bacterium]|nr:alanine racemase [Alphaproteobacteria bacterium]
MDIRNYLNFEPVGNRLEDLETPVPLIDIGVVDQNLKRWQAHCDRQSLANRPHIKTHKLTGLARYQLDLGARGITVQKLGEAEVMADAGISDMLLTFNLIGRHKLQRLADLAGRTEISVVADNAKVVEGLAWAGSQAGRDIGVLVECDTGAARNGVQSPAAAADLARLIDRTSGVRYAGLMTFPRAGMRVEMAEYLGEASDLLGSSGLKSQVISAGGSPDMWKDEGLEKVTEYRAGTYVYFDRSLVARGTCALADCAVTVLTTVVSRPTDGRAMVDAGSKALTSDLLGLTGYGVIPDFASAPVYDLSEEHGFVDVSACPTKPAVGDVLRILPNHVCPVQNLFDRVVFIDGSEVLGAVKVDARGLVQ